MKNISICLLLILSIFLFTTSCTETDSQLPEVSPEEVADNDEAVDFDNSQVEEPEFTFPEPSAVENNYHLEEAFPGLFFTRPLDLQNAGDGSGRLFVVEQAGMIYVVEGPAYSEKEVFLDIRDLVDDSGNEMGLLGLAFHPQYIENGYFYINYTDRSGTVIARFNASGNIAEPASRKTIMSFSQPYRNHNGGQLSFGPDGYLYISTGDGGSGGDPQGHGQNLQTIHGNILRIDVNSERSEDNYTIPPDNPFTNSDEGALEEIYAYGLRNPWRFSFDPMTGNLWAADVGQNRVEEINIIDEDLKIYLTAFDGKVYRLKKN
ncbi:MAG: PQQ-dependent sugar dehydrogenase [Bacillota bacterium]|nr:PQQ-dependent sugar dehydrogenase [Bacillota bacterium]